MENEKAPERERVETRNLDMAIKLYKMLEDVAFNDVIEIGEYLKILAVNLKA